MFPHLHGLWVNVSLVQEAASKELIEILDKCDGTKVISAKHIFVVAIFK